MDVSQSQMDGVLTDAIHRIDLNEPSVYDPSLPGTVTTTRTFTNTGSKNATYSVSAQSDLAGGVSVSPSTFTVKPGKSATISVTLNGVDGTVGHFYYGRINLTQSNGTHRLHLPVAFRPSNASTAPSVTLSSSCTPTSIAVGAQTTCTANVQNNAFEPATVSATMTSTNNLKIVDTGKGHGRVGSFGPVTLAAAAPPKPHVEAGDSPFGYFNLSAFATGALRAIGDDQIVNFNVPAFVYDGQTYTRLGIVSNGYLVVGGGDGTDVVSTPPAMPNPAHPNNVLAPFWTDLDSGNGSIPGQGYRIAVLSAGPQSWIVVQWDEHPFNGAVSTFETFQTWIGINGTQDISFAYDPTHLLADPSAPFQVGAEDVSGQFGNNLPGLPTNDLVVTSSAAVPGGTASFTAPFRGTQVGAGVVEVDLVSSLSRDTSVRRMNVTVTP
jgi:hypothetical protein